MVQPGELKKDRKLLDQLNSEKDIDMIMKTTELSNKNVGPCEGDSVNNEHFTALEVENGVRAAR